MDGKLDATMMDLYYFHKRVVSTVMGGGVKGNDIRKMIGWWKEGKFPVEEVGQVFRCENSGRGGTAQHGGKCGEACVGMVIGNAEIN